MDEKPGKKPKADFVVRLVGPNLRPWVVPMRSLTRVLDAVQRLIEQKDDGDGAGEGADRTLRLLGVREQSAGYAISAPNPALALDVLQYMGKSIHAPIKADWTPATLSSIKELSEIAKSMDCKIEFRSAVDDARLGDVVAVIKPQTYIKITGYAFIHGHTSIFGRIERVGGATAMHCGLRVPSQPTRMVICRVMSEELVRELGRYMYQDVLVSGRATWIRHGRRLKRLEITAFEPPKKGSILDALKDIYDAGGSEWDKIENPDTYLSEIRGN